jgi:glycerol-3-phosphate acyltransferase PlsY
MIYINYVGFLYNLFEQYRDSDQTLAIIFYCLGMLICVVVPYLLGSFNTAIIVSKYLYHDDIRKYGSGNAGLTNMHRVYGKKGALYTLGGDVLKQFLSVSIGMLVMGLDGAFLAGTFCILGHIAPIYFHFKGGKGVLAAATMVLMMDPVLFVILFAFFALIVLIFKYISLGSMMAGFVYPALVFYRNKIMFDNSPPSFAYMLFACFIGILIIFMHRENMKRIYNNEESKFSFKKKPLKVEEAEEAEKKSKKK